MCRASFFSTSAMPSSAITEIAWEAWKPLTSLIRSITGSWVLMIQYLSGGWVSACAARRSLRRLGAVHPRDLRPVHALAIEYSGEFRSRLCARDVAHGGEAPRDLGVGQGRAQVARDARAQRLRHLLRREQAVATE